MTGEEKSRVPQTPHCLTLDERQQLAVSGVEEVVSFDENEVTVQTVRGLLIVRGGELKVDRLEKSAGTLGISGLVTELCYEETRPEQGFWGRLFR